MGYINNWKQEFEWSPTTVVILSVIATGVLAPIVAVCTRYALGHIIKKIKRL